MLTLSLIFSFGGDAPNLFGRNIYIVKTDVMEGLNPGTAIITGIVAPDELVPGDIVVFKNVENRAGVAEIITVKKNDNIYGFDAVSERGANIVLTQSQIVGKALEYSDFLGGLIGFAKSPAGVLVIAVIPCMIILVYEGSKSMFAVLRGGGKVAPVKKQDEIPTYIPRQKMSAATAISAYSKTENSKTSELEIKSEIKKEEEYPFFKQPKSKAIVIEKPQKKPAPLSQKKLNDAIAAINAQNSFKNELRSELNEDVNRTASFFASETADIFEPESISGKEYMEQLEGAQTSEIKRLLSVNDEPPKSPPPVQESVKRYTPKKKETPVRSSARSTPRTAQNTSAIPSLDRLLKEDDGEAENTRYNIEDILFSIDRKKV
ncbi:MAG: hypothetical protein FWG44_02770 [Oscillospiraceae bacterium]|nr:hypothetical protein [Oscillospiraceae bacterium]